MFIFYKMEYVIAYKILLKDSIDENMTFLGMSLVLSWSMRFYWISCLLSGINDTASLWLTCFCNANVKYTSTFQCCYGQRLLILSSLNVHWHYLRTSPAAALEFTEEQTSRNENRFIVTRCTSMNVQCLRLKHLGARRKIQCTITNIVNTPHYLKSISNLQICYKFYKSNNRNQQNKALL